MDPNKAQFDVFLSHNSLDKTAVRQLGSELQKRGFSVWLDEWELIPGRPWQNALEDIIGAARTAVVVIGKDGLGPWELPEMQGCISEFVTRKLPVIPVLLPGAPAQCQLPLFLKQFVWVDLRDGFTDEGLDKIQWGIQGKKPDKLKTPESPLVGSHYVDFALRVGQRAGTVYRVEVVRSPAGVAAQSMSLPYEGLALQNCLQSLQIQLLRSLTGTAGNSHRAAMSVDDRQVRDLGGKLFDSLITGPIRTCYDKSQHLAKQNGLGLRLRLSIESPEIAVLPWEYIYDPREREFLCFLNTPFVRHLGDSHGMRPLNVASPLRILGMVSSPNGLPELKAEYERHRVEDSLRLLLEQKLVQLHWLKGGTWKELNEQLSSEDWHVFHFVGHGQFDTRQDEGVLLFEDERGMPSDFSATQLSRLFNDRLSLRLFVLNACQSATGSTSDIFSGTAATMVRRGVPAVVAMQQNVSDTAAVEFSREFYRALAEALPVDVAVAQGRKAIQAAQKNSLEWGTPVLFMNSEDGVLFVRKPSADGPSVINKQSDQGNETPVRLPPEKTGKVRQITQPKLDHAYWRTGELPVALVVACNDPVLAARVADCRKPFEKPLPVFESCDQHSFATSEQFRFEWQSRASADLLSVIDEFLIQNSSRMLIVVSDSLTDQNTSGSNNPSDLTLQIRQRFLHHPHFCGLVGLVPGAPSRTHDVDRTLDSRTLSETALRQAVTKVADGLRLKAPPGNKLDSGQNEAILVQLAQTESDLEACFRLRHQIYDRMNYLDDELSQLTCELEMDSYDQFDATPGTGSLHFVAKIHSSGEVVGTGRLILARRIQGNLGATVIGPAPAAILQLQAALLKEILKRCDSGNVLKRRLNAPRSCTLPLLQSTALFEKTRETLKDVDALAELSRLVVVPRLRGSGVSKVLVRAMMAVAFDIKKTKIVLECVPTHVPMYEKFGFAAIPGTHTRAESLDQEAVAMALLNRSELAKVLGIINSDLDMIRSGLSANDPQMLAGRAHLCLCRESGCWLNGRYEMRVKQACPLCDLHRKKELQKQP